MIVMSSHILDLFTLARTHWKWLVGGAMAIAIPAAFVWQTIRYDTLEAKYDAVRKSMNEIVLAIRTVSGQKDLPEDKVAAQVYAFGRTIDSATDQIDRQSAAFEALAREREEALAQAAAARKAKESAIRTQKQLAERLEAEALLPGEREDIAAQMLAAQKTLDQLYEVGL